MSKRVYITGAGIISSIGHGLKDTLDSLINCKTGISEINILNTVHKNIPVAEVKLTNNQLAQINNLKSEKGFTRTSLMCLAAVADAMNSAGIDDVAQCRTGLISATTVGGMDMKEHFFSQVATSEEWLEYIDTQDVAEHTERIADMLGIKDFVTTVSTACSSGANAIMLGARLIKSGIVDRVIAGGGECLTRFHLNGFNSLMILDKEPCKPFDNNRAGITLGEGAAYVVIESEEIARRKKDKILCELTGYGNSCEAFHPTASSPEGTGAYLAMLNALDKSGLKPSDINYINAHGTGTDSNDISEATAIKRVFGDDFPPVSSTKPYTGHTTSAAGSIEAIICILSIMNNIVFPNLNWKTPMADIDFLPVDKIIKKEINHVLSNSFGFGGNNTSLIFSKYRQ